MSWGDANADGRPDVHFGGAVGQAGELWINQGDGAFRIVAVPVLQEDADGVGLSLLSGAHLTLFPRVIAEPKDRDLDDVMIFGGGVIPDGDVAILKEQGVSEIFGPGSSLRAIGEWLEAALDARESA